MINRMNGNLKTGLLVIALVGNALMVGSMYGKMSQNMTGIDRNQVKIENRLKTIENRLYIIETTGIDNRYRKTDAVRDFGLRDNRLDRLELKLDTHVKNRGGK